MVRTPQKLTYDTDDGRLNSSASVIVDVSGRHVVFYEKFFTSGLTGSQVVGTFTVYLSWGASSGSDQYIVERATDAAFTINLTTVYTGPSQFYSDDTPGPNLYYYRVKAQVTSIQLESFWSPTFPFTVILSSIDFSGFPTSAFLLSAVQFTYTGSTVPGISFLWDFGDSYTGPDQLLQNPLHTYNAIGNFTVSLTVTVPGGSASETKPDYILIVAAPPIADFTATPVVGEYPLVAQFTDTTTCLYPIVSWEWDFGDGTEVSTEQNPLHTYNVPGTYTVSLRVVNYYSISDTETKSNYVIVNGINLLVDFVGVPREGESPLVVDFTNLTQIPAGHSALSWLWDFGDGTTSALRDPSHTYYGGGFFTVTLKAFVSL